jgi:hypothetical protein
VVNEHFRELVVPRTEAFQFVIVAAHSAVGAIFAAEIGNLNDGAHENMRAKILARRDGGALMKLQLFRAAQSEF